MRLFIVIIALIGFSACNQAFFENNVNIENHEWFYKDTIAFEFALDDTTSTYDLFLNVRHTNDYEFSNLWVNLETIYPNGESQVQPINLPMADNTGKWYGKGDGGIFSTQSVKNKIILQQNAQMPLKGNYKLNVIQNMRINPLPYIMDVGVIIKKAE